MDHSILEILNSRTEQLPGHMYKLMGSHTPDQFGMDVVIPDNLDVDEGEMSVVIPFADGRRRDGVGDLLEVGGINTERHIKNPIVLFDHGKKVDLPIGLTEDPQTKEYLVSIDPVLKQARAKAFFYQGNGNLTGISPRGGPTKEYDHALFCEQLFDLVSKRFIRAGSIGYQVINAKHLMPDYEFGTPQGLHLLSVRMLEVSVVVMPANQDTVSKCLSMPKICGKPLSPYLVKSLAPYAPARKAQMGYQGQKAGMTESEREASNNRLVPRHTTYIRDSEITDPNSMVPRYGPDVLKQEREAIKHWGPNPYDERQQRSIDDEETEAREARGEKGVTYYTDVDGRRRLVSDQDSDKYMNESSLMGFAEEPPRDAEEQEYYDAIPKPGQMIKDDEKAFPEREENQYKVERQVVRNNARKLAQNQATQPKGPATSQAPTQAPAQAPEPQQKAINSKPLLPSYSDEKVEYKISNESKERQQNTAKQNQTRLSNMRKEREAKGEKKLDAVVQPPLKDASYTGRVPPPKWKPGVGAVKAVVNPSTPPSPVGPRVSVGDSSSVSEIQAVHNIAANQKIPPTGEPQQKAQANVDGATIKDQDEEKRSNTRALGSYNAIPPLTDEAERHYESIPKPGPMSEQKQLATQATGQLGFKLDKVKQKSLRAKYAPQVKSQDPADFEPLGTPEERQQLKYDYYGTNTSFDESPYRQSRDERWASQDALEDDRDGPEWHRFNRDVIDNAYEQHYIDNKLRERGIKATGEPGYEASQGNVYNDPDYIDLDQTSAEALAAAYPSAPALPVSQDPDRWTVSDFEIYDLPDTDEKSADNEQVVPTIKQDLPYVEMQKPLRAARDENYYARELQRNIQKLEEANRIREEIRNYPKPAINGPRVEASDDDWLGAYSYLDYPEYEIPEQEKAIPLVGSRGREIRAADRRDQNQAAKPQGRRDAYGNVINSQGEVTSGSTMKAPAPRPTAGPNMEGKSQPSDKISKGKARQMLKDGTAHGHVLTDKQRRMLGAAASKNLKALTPDEKIRYYAEASDIDPSKTEYGVDFTDKTGQEAWRAVNEGRMNNRDRMRYHENNYENYLKKPSEEKGLDFDTPIDEAGSMKAYEPREGEYITYLQHEDNAGSDFAIRGPASIDPRSRRSVFINTHDPATNEPVQVPVPKSQIHKGKSVKDLRAKYAAPKELTPNKVKIMRHKTLGAKQGNSMVYMDEKDLPKAREHAKQCGLVMELAGQLSDGRAKVRVRGYDDAIDSLAQRFGTVPAKSGKKNCKSLPKQVAKGTKAAPKKGDRISGSYLSTSLNEREPNNPNFGQRQVQGTVDRTQQAGVANLYDTIPDDGGDHVYLYENEIDEIEPRTEEKAFDEKGSRGLQRFERKYDSAHRAAIREHAKPLEELNQQGKTNAVLLQTNEDHLARGERLNTEADQAQARLDQRREEGKQREKSKQKGIPNPINPGPRADHDKNRHYHRLKDITKMISANQKAIEALQAQVKELSGDTKSDEDLPYAGYDHDDYNTHIEGIRRYVDSGEGSREMNNQDKGKDPGVVINDMELSPRVPYIHSYRTQADLDRYYDAGDDAVQEAKERKQGSKGVKSDDFDEPDILAERRALSRSYNADHALPVNSNYYTEHREGRDPRDTERARDHKESYIHRHMRDQS